VIKDLCVLSHLEIIEYTSETILELIEGEWLQDENFKQTDIKEDRLKEVHRLKTGALFSWCFKAPFLLSNKKEADVQRACKVGELFGHLLQRSDDLLDFDIRNFEKKEFFKDLPSGNLNLFAYNIVRDKDHKDKAYSFKTMNDFLEFYSIDLSAEVKKFDAKSLEMISDLQNLIDEFDDFSKDFKEQLKTMSQLIYWRTSDESKRY
jgi:octaprenyl-diphosphate synthase